MYKVYTTQCILRQCIGVHSRETMQTTSKAYWYVVGCTIMHFNTQVTIASKAYRYNSAIDKRPETENCSVIGEICVYSKTKST